MLHGRLECCLKCAPSLPIASTACRNGSERTCAALISTGSRPRTGAWRTVELYDLQVTSESSSEGALKNFVMLVAWATVVAMLMGGLGAIASDFLDRDLALGIGGSSIDIPQDRYMGVLMLGFAGGLAAVLRFGGGVADFLRRHKIAVGIVALAACVGLVIFGGRLVEWLDGGPAVSAAMNGDTQTLREMFDADQVDPADHGAMLCWAAQRGDIDTLELLLAKGVSPNAPRDDGASALSLACSYGGEEAVDLLISAGATGECAMPPA